MVFRWLIRKVSKTSVFIFIFLCVSFSLIFFVSGLFNKAIEKQQLSSFRREIDNTTSALALRLDIYQALLYSGKGLIESNNAIMSPEKWHTYVATLQFDKNYPGVHTYSYGFIFSDQQKAAFLSQMHQQVGKNFTISPAGKRQTYAVVSYIEPLTDQTKTGLGVDILPDAARAKDLEKAIQTGSIVVSGKSILFTDAQKEPAFIMRIVFYKPGMSLDTASEREKAAVGFVNTTFRMRILVGAVLSQVKNDIEYAIYDGGDSNNLTPDRLFFSNLPANWKTSGRFVEKHTFSIGDHAWTILFYDNSTLTLRDRYAPWVLPAGLMFISCLMACLLYFLITSRKRAIKLAEQMTEEFRKSEQKYRTIFETLQDVYYETDIQGNIITISPSIESYTGIAQQDILGKKATDFYINPKEREQLLSILHTDGFVLDFETSLKGKEGNTLTVSVTSKMLRNNEGKPVGVAGMLRDITRRKHAEENVKRKNHELEKAQEELDRLVKKLQGDKRKLEEAMTKDEFLSMAAHELRTPLGTMRWRIEEMLGSGRKLSPATKEDLEKMYNNILRLLDIVNKLLDVSRINQEKIKENPQMIDVVHLATMVIDTLEERIHEQDIHMVFEKTKKAVAFFIDQNLLEEIFVNLLTNAIKYNNKGGNVTLIIEEKPAGLSIEVTDTGIGIPTKDQKTIFQKFKRASNVDPRKYEGNGLGLFVVKSYVEHWKGKITLVSREGKGTKVTIVIPKKTS